MSEPVAIFSQVDNILASHVPPGAGQFIERHGAAEYLALRCPCGCSAISAIAFGPGGWTLGGTRERPTVTPAFRSVGGCGWSGELVDGAFIASQA